MDYKNYEAFSEEEFDKFLKELGLDKTTLSKNELLEWSGKYMDAMRNAYMELSKKGEIISFLDMNFNEIDFKNYIQKTNTEFLNNLPFHLIDTEVAKKFDEFVKRHNLKLNIEFKKEKHQEVVKEEWYSEVGIYFCKVYELNNKVFGYLPDKVNKEIISLQLETDRKIYDYEISFLSDKDKVKFYTYKLNKYIKNEEYEKAANMRDLISKLEVEK